MRPSGNVGMSQSVQVRRATKLAGGFCILNLMEGRDPPGMPRAAENRGIGWAGLGSQEDDVGLRSE